MTLSDATIAAIHCGLRFPNIDAEEAMVNELITAGISVALDASPRWIAREVRRARGVENPDWV